MEKHALLTEQEEHLFEDMTAQLLTGKPLQYLTSKAWFMGREFYVDEHVLIPRPETEELVQWVLDDHKDDTVLSIIDIGTGSGCIPISLKLALNKARITTCDVSYDAIEVAKRNARKLEAAVEFIEIDFLQEAHWPLLGKYDVIVSNPPYIPIGEKNMLHVNVQAHEPELALFVPDEDALLFYRKIALFGKGHLKKGGMIYCEAHTDHALATAAVFEEQSYTGVIAKKDLHDNMRMVRATL